MDPLNMHGTLMKALGIEIEEATPNRVVATMPVEDRTHKPFELLHGGASLALAETVASIGAQLQAGPGLGAVGMQVNASHVRAKHSGSVRAVATPSYVGRTSTVWEVRIADEHGQPVCLTKCTLAFVPKESPVAR